MMKKIRAITKFIGDYRFYRRRGESVRNAWRLAHLTI